MSSRLNRSSMEDMLPPNLMFDILSRLPVKSIIYFKSVCKKWQNLVSDPYFVHLHLSKSPEALMMYEDLKPEQPGTLNWVEMKHKPHHIVPVIVNKLHLQRCPYLSGRHIVPVGSVNGLICCCLLNNAMYIFNPVYEQYITIPPPRRPLATITCGFGVSTTGEYKVIRIIVNPHDRVYEIGVYTLGTCKWRLLRQKPPYVHKSIKNMDPGVVVGNHVYWLLPDAKIYDFDSDLETFELFPSPPESKEQELGLMLGVLKGMLSRIAWFSLGLEVWVMKEGCWYKEIAIQQVISPVVMWSDESEPLCLIDGFNGTSVLMVHNRETKDVVVFCLNTNTILEFELRGDFNSFVLTYRPSFVKLDNFGSERVHALQEEEVGLALDAFEGSHEHKDEAHNLTATTDLVGRQDGMRNGDDSALEKGNIEQGHSCPENAPVDLADENEASSDLDSEISDEIYDSDDSDDSDEHDYIEVLKNFFWPSRYADLQEEGEVDGSKDADDGEGDENVIADAGRNAK